VTTPSDDHHRLSMTVLMTPDMSNFAGNVHGGILLKYLDQVAYTCATRYARTYAVTLSVDQVVFREPVHVGELVTFDASVNRTGRTSMEVGVRVTTQDLVRQTVRHTNSCYFTMVTLGPDSRPVPVPPWQPRTAEERRRHLAAERRSRLRREIDRAGTQIKQTSHDEATGPELVPPSAGRPGASPTGHGAVSAAPGQGSGAPSRAATVTERPFWKRSPTLDPVTAITLLLFTQ